MALPPTFTSRVPTAVARVAEAQVTPSVIGQAASVLGRTMGQIGQQRHDVDQQIADSQARIREREIARDRQAATVDATVRMVRGSAELSTKIADLEANAPVGGAGHADAVDQAWAQWRDGFMATLPDDEEIRGKFAASLEEDGANIRVQARQFERGQRIEKQANDIDEAIGILANLAASNPTPASAAMHLKTLNSAIDAMDLQGNDAEKLKRVAAGSIWGAQLGSLIDGGNHAQAAALIDKGFYDTLLKPEQVKAARGRIDVEQRRDEAEAAAAIRKEEAAAKEKIGLITDQLKQGLYVDDATLQQAAGLARQYGLPRQFFDLDVARVEASTNRRYADATPVQLRGAIGAYKDRIKQAGAKAAPEDIIALRRLEELQGKKRDDLAAPYKDAWSQGVPGRLSVAAQLRAMPLEERVAVAQKVDSSGALARAVQLPPTTMQMAINGRADREGNPELLPTPNDIQKAFNAVIGQAAASLDGEGLAAIRDTAADIYARMAREGGIKSFDRDSYAQAVSLALGRQGNGGGLGGYKGKPVILPAGVSSGDLEGAIVRHDFAAADGTAAIIKDRFMPRWIGEDESGKAQYAFIDDRGRWLKHKGGNRPYILDVGQ